MITLKCILFVLVCFILAQSITILKRSGLTFQEKAFMLTNIVFYCIASLLFGFDLLSREVF